MRTDVKVINGSSSAPLPELLLEETVVVGDIDIPALKRWALRRHDGFDSAGIGVMAPGGLVEVVLTRDDYPREES